MGVLKLTDRKVEDWKMTDYDIPNPHEFIVHRAHIHRRRSIETIAR